MKRSRHKLDGKTTRDHAEAILRAGIPYAAFEHARISLTYRTDYGWGGALRGPWYGQRAYLNRVGKMLRHLSRV